MWFDEQSLEIIGKFLYEKRISSKKTQNCIAKAIGYSSAQYVSNWERGVCPPPRDSLILISEAYGISKSELADKLVAESEKTIYRQLKLKRRKHILSKAL